MDTRVYLFTGFLDSGKSSFIKDTVIKTDFCENEKTLLIVSEQGEIKYDVQELKSHDCDLIYISSSDEWSLTHLQQWENQYHPTQVLVEVNGMFNVDDFMKQHLPPNWSIVQVLTTINTQTFSLYLQNMRSLFYQHVVYSDLVVLNRIQDSVKKSYLRNNIKAINSNCQIIYEKEDGTVQTLENDELPYDINENYIHISDYNFGIFCMDLLEEPQKYNHKKITIKGKFIGLDKVIPHGFILGRQALVCCEDDTSLIGLICTHDFAHQFIPNEWLELTGTLNTQYDENNRIISILNVDSLKVVPPLKNEYVSFD